MVIFGGTVDFFPKDIQIIHGKIRKYTENVDRGLFLVDRTASLV